MIKFYSIQGREEGEPWVEIFNTSDPEIALVYAESFIDDPDKPCLIRVVDLNKSEVRIIFGVSDKAP